MGGDWPGESLQTTLKSAENAPTISPEIAKIPELAALPALSAFPGNPPADINGMCRRGCTPDRIRQNYVSFSFDNASFWHVGHIPPYGGKRERNRQNPSRKCQNDPKDFPRNCENSGTVRTFGAFRVSRNPPGCHRRHVQTWMYARQDCPGICTLFIR